MELFLILLVVWLLIAPIVAMVKSSGAREASELAKREVARLRSELEGLRRRMDRQGTDPAQNKPPPSGSQKTGPKFIPVAGSKLVAEPELPPQTAPLPPDDYIERSWAAPAAPPPPELETESMLGGSPEFIPAPEEALAADSAPPLPPTGALPPDGLMGAGETPPAAPKPSAPPPAPRTPINLEQFMGVKLFAWLGGVALFFGVLFFVKYAFDKRLLSPSLQIALGYLVGVGVLVTGLVLHRRGTHVSLSNSFCATGVVAIYGVTFAAYALERYQLLGQVSAFLLMALTTVVAFLLAVRLNALVVAVLGLIGGYLTPVMVSSGKDELFILTVYIALLSAGLVAISRHRGWRFLPIPAGVGALLYSIGWFVAHFDPGGYGRGFAVTQPMGALLVLQLVFFAAVWLERRREGARQPLDLCVYGMLAAGWIFGFVLLGYPWVASRLGLIYGWTLLQVVAVAALVWMRPALGRAQVVSAGLFAAHMVAWFGMHFGAAGFDRGLRSLQPMAVVLVFEALALGLIMRERRRGIELEDASLTALIALATGWFLSFGFLAYSGVASRLGLIYGWTLLQTAAVTALVWVRPSLGRAQVVSAGLFAAHMVAWFGMHFGTAGSGRDARPFEPMAVVLVFEALALCLVVRERRRGIESKTASHTALIVLSAGWFLSFGFLWHVEVAQRMALIHGWVAVQLSLMLALAWLRPRLLAAHAVATALAFVHLAVWSGWYLTPVNLNSTLMVYLAFGAGGSILPLFLFRRQPPQERVSDQIWPWAAVAPLLLALVCLVTLPEPSLRVWGMILAASFLVVALVPRVPSVLPLAACLVLSLVFATFWLLRAPETPGELTPILDMSISFALFFAAAGFWTGRRMAKAEDDRERQIAHLLPAAAGILPFGLLLLAEWFLQPVPAAPVFGVALLLGVLLLGLGVIDRFGLLVPFAAAGVFLVHAVWHATALETGAPCPTLAWYAGCFLLFLAFPFVFQRVFAKQFLPWISSALAGPAWFLLVYPLAKHAFHPALEGRLGLVPAAFAATSLLALWRVVRMEGALDAGRLSRLAWHGGVALLFITLIFPIQFQRQWITVSWAVEGALLLWLFRRVPHRGLQYTGLALLGTAFVRLAFNPAIVTTYARAETPIFNWHLYAYGLVAASLFMGAWWFSDPGNRLAPARPRGILHILCGILLFILLNLEIADFFTPAGQTRVSLGGSANFARDMSYSIGWGIYALVLLGIGIWKNLRPVRYAAIGLLGVTLLKLFLFDLAALRSIYRVGALMGVAVIAFIASFLYQQFFNRSRKP